MTNIAQAAVARKTVRVQVPVKRAFSVFAEQMETWWPAAHHIRAQPFQAIFVEPRVGGRWYERDAHGNVCDWGQVLAWAPPHRVAFSWRLGPDFKFNPDLAKASEVEIRFTAEGYEQLRAIMDGPGAWEATLSAFATAADHPPVR